MNPNIPVRRFHLDPKIPVVVLPGSDWSFQVLTRVPYLYKVEAQKGTSLEVLIVLECIRTRQVVCRSRVSEEGIDLGRKRSWQLFKWRMLLSKREAWMKKKVVLAKWGKSRVIRKSLMGWKLNIRGLSLASDTSFPLTAKQGTYAKFLLMPPLSFLSNHDTYKKPFSKYIDWGINLT